MSEGFQYHTLDTMGSIADLNDWLTVLYRDGIPMALAIKGRVKKLALATRDDSWVLDLKSPLADIAMSILKTQYTRLNILTRNAAADIPEFVKIAAPMWGVDPAVLYSSVAERVTGDMTAVCTAINQTALPHNKFPRVENDAFEIALLEPQYRIDCPPYYQKIGLPLAKLIGEARVHGAATPQWWVSYEHLWLRVLAYYTNDPTLIWAFHENRDPIETIGAIFNFNQYDTETLLLWACCGFDLAVFNRSFPTRSKLLPPDLAQYNQKIKEKLPSVWMNINYMREAYQVGKVAETLYGRRLRPNGIVGSAVFHRIFGTVEDIVSVVAVALHNNRTSDTILVTQFAGSPSEGLIRVNGVGPGPGGMYSWSQLLRDLAPLNDPLGVTLPLKPLVTVV